MNKDKFYKAWWWLTDSHEWATLKMHIDVVKVHPKLKRVVNDEKKNTLVNYWIEGGPWEKSTKKEIASGFPEYMPTHDIRLDCGADTFEEAVTKYAKLVKKFYGPRTVREGVSK